MYELDDIKQNQGGHCGRVCRTAHYSQHQGTRGNGYVLVCWGYQYGNCGSNSFHVAHAVQNGLKRTETSDDVYDGHVQESGYIATIRIERVGRVCRTAQYSERQGFRGKGLYHERWCEWCGIQCECARWVTQGERECATMGGVPHMVRVIRVQLGSHVEYKMRYLKYSIVVLYHICVGDNNSVMSGDGYDKIIHTLRWEVQPTIT